MDRKRLYEKYASCRHSHSAIEAAIDIMKINNIDLDEITKVNIYTYQSAIIGHDHKVVEGVNAAKMSTPYSVAVALVTGEGGGSMSIQ